MNQKLKLELGKLDNVQLQEVSQYILNLRTINGNTGLTVGAKVWVIYRDGSKHKGVVTKINPKKAIVKMNGMLYRVHKAMLELR